MLKKVKQLAFVDIGVVILIEILECLAHCSPLLSDLVDELNQDVPVSHLLLRCDPFVATLAPLIFLEVHLIVRVALRVVSENETCQVMNLIAHPDAEVVVVESSRAICLRIDSLHDFDQVSVLDRDVGPVQRHDVFRLDKAVMVLVNR